jgi:hypothetical protein
MEDNLEQSSSCLDDTTIEIKHIVFWGYGVE